MRNHPYSSGKVEVVRGTACRDPSQGQEKSAPRQSLKRHLICRQEQLACNPWNWPDYARSSASQEKETASQNPCQDWQGLLASCRRAWGCKWSSSHSSVTRASGAGYCMNLAPSQPGHRVAVNLPFLLFRNQPLTFSLSICRPSVAVIWRAAPNVLLYPELI